MKQYTYDYPHPAVTADCIVFAPDGHALKVLLIQRAQEPCKGMWAFPGGFMQIDETADQCAIRELREETSLQLTQVKQLGAFSDVNRDPRERVITIAFYALTHHCEVRGGDDAALAQWFPINELPPLAFDHDLILQQAIIRLHQDLRLGPEGTAPLGSLFSTPDLLRIRQALEGLK